MDDCMGHDDPAMSGERRTGRVDKIGDVKRFDADAPPTPDEGAIAMGSAGC